MRRGRRDEGGGRRWKFQITNHKKQTNSNDWNSKFQKKRGLKGLVIEIWNLFEIWCLGFEICPAHSKLNVGRSMFDVHPLIWAPRDTTRLRPPTCIKKVRIKTPLDPLCANHHFIHPYYVIILTQKAWYSLTCPACSGILIDYEKRYIPKTTGLEIKSQAEAASVARCAANWKDVYIESVWSQWIWKNHVLQLRRGSRARPVF